MSEPPTAELDHTTGKSPASLTLDQVRGIVSQVLSPAHFFIADPTILDWEHRDAEELYWEVFNGHLLDGSQTRQRCTFEAWNVHRVDAATRSAEPIIAVKLDAAAGILHVTRSVLRYAWEAYADAGNVIQSRETVKWVRELVGSVRLAEFASQETLRAELTGLLFQAVVGVSRLPLTSVEAPLPGFTLGELGYFSEAARDSLSAEPAPMTCPEQLVAYGLQPELPWLEKSKLLELLLRATPADQLAESAELFPTHWRTTGHEIRKLAALLRTLFEEVALSPYTDFVDKTLAWLRHLKERGHLATAEVVDFLGYLLRHIVRHLTAYDLVTFHHRGANYPDALLLDATLKTYLALIDRHQELFCDEDGNPEANPHRLRRRALRQAWLLRCRYEGHPVPDAPTSPGENLRVMPPPFTRVLEEQILDPSRRTLKLFENDPLEAHLTLQSRAVLQQALLDLENPPELRELGIALFLDRPLGVFKPPGERDQTVLLSYEAFSQSVAVERLRFLAETLGLMDANLHALLRRRLETGLSIQGIAPAASAGFSRPGVVSLDDARLVAGDFVFLRTTRRSVQDFLDQFDFSPLAERISLDYLAQPVLILRGAAPGQLTIYDAQFRKRLELEADPRDGYASRGGKEYPRAGLQVLRAWEPVGGAGQAAGLSLLELPNQTAASPAISGGRIYIRAFSEGGK